MRRALAIERRDLLLPEQSEVPQVAPGVAVVDVHQELIELVGRRHRPVEPHRARFRLAELGAGRRRHERRRDRMRIEPGRATNELDTGGDVAPLVAAAHLQPHVVTAPQLQEVICLKQHVREFRVRDASLHPPLHGILLEHVVHREVLADVAHEIHGAQSDEPLRVVDEHRCIRAAEIEKTLELLADVLGVLRDRVHVRERTLRSLAARVANQSRTAAGERDRTMSVPLQSNEEHDHEQAADMQAGRGRVESDVSARRSVAQELANIFGMLVQKPTPFQVFEQRMRSHGTKIDIRGMNYYGDPIHEKIP